MAESRFSAPPLEQREGRRLETGEEREKGYGLEEMQVGGSSATNEAMVLRSAMRRKKEDRPMRARQLEREEERDREEKEKLL